ncbi:MAG TPA: aldehyde dehydrogenase family protein, partial [Solirubrobacterales bacterium]|nr:aldehyde dehydrogenase family protein [Solirubrobacterales bacterium]
MSMLSVIEPATARLMAEVPQAGVEETDAAVAKAKAAFPAWRDVAPGDRASLIHRLADALAAEHEELARLEARNAGKPIGSARGEIGMAIDTFRYYAGAPERLLGKTIPVAGGVDMTFREPLGVVGLIVPWNFPLTIASWKAAPALAAGNTIVLKPAELTPLTAIELERVALAAGIPEGVLNVVVGPGRVCGQRLVEHPDVAKIAFTGSTEIGKLMLVYAGQSNMKRVALECGGKSPQIFLADLEDLDRAVSYAINGIYGNMGEVCNAGSRLLIDKPIAGAFIERFIERGRTAYRAGDPLDPETNLGPLVTAQHRSRVLDYIGRGKREGARLEFGGDAPELPGSYVNPTLFSRVSNGMTIAREEIFGPVAAAIEVNGLEEALKIANDSIYGLAASVWTRDLA